MKRAADSAVRTAIKQIINNPGGIILDYTENTIDLKKIEKIINDRLKRSGAKLGRGITVIIKIDSNVLKTIRYKK